NSGSLNLHLNAGVGDITFNSGSYIGTSGGDFSASGQNFDVSTGTGNPVISTDGGDILLDMSGAVWLRREVKTNGGNFTVENSSSFSSYFPNAKIDTSGNEDNRNGGLVTLTANGDIKVTSISTIGAPGVPGSRTGGAGGEVSLTSKTGLIEVGSINTSGGDGYSSIVNNHGNGGVAGNITIT